MAGGNYIVEITVEEDISNFDFLEKYARKGRVGMVAGTTLGHLGVRWAQSVLTPDGRASLWSHVVIFSEETDQEGPCLYESDIRMIWSRLKLLSGAQKNCISKYADPSRYPYLAILDFHLSEEKVIRVLECCRQMIAKGIRYPISGLLGTGFALFLKRERKRSIWSSDRALFCSAFAQEAFRAAGIEFCPGVDITNLAPEHIWQTEIVHSVYLRRKERSVLSGRYPQLAFD